jgi:hypothetical protein
MVALDYIFLKMPQQQTTTLVHIVQQSKSNFLPNLSGSIHCVRGHCKIHAIAGLYFVYETKRVTA